VVHKDRGDFKVVMERVLLIARRHHPVAAMSLRAAFLFALFTIGTAIFSTYSVVARNKPDYREGERAMRRGEYEKAAKFFLDLVEKNGQDIRARLGASLAYLKLQNYRLCYEQAGAVLKLDEKNSMAHALAGLALLRSGYFPNAINEFIRAIQLNQKEALAFGGLAEIDYYENRPKDARDKAYYAFTLDPNEGDYLITFARASARIEKFSDAADAYERFLQVAPKTDTERRERIKGLIQFYRSLSGLQLHQISGPQSTAVVFWLGSDRRPYVQVRVNGRNAIFVVDTGSGFTVVSTASASRLGISPKATGGKSQGIGGTGKFPIVYGLIGSIQIGEIKIESVPCFIREFHGPKDRPPMERADGFIGLSVLSNFLTELDYKNHLMRLDRNLDKGLSALVSSPGVTIIPFRTTQNGLISIETQLDDGHLINAILDSGASSTVISTAAVERLKMHDRIIKGQTVQVIGAAGVANNVELLYIRNCQVADLRQENLRALVLDFGAINETSGFEQSGILGGDFLRHFRIAIDFARAQVALEPQTTAITRLQSLPKAEPK
jgi:predicted aspartyl protease/tetratricopeptide (TPR) repeat protein